MNIESYLDLAREAGKFASDRELGRALGLKSAAVCQFRKGQAVPSESTIIKLAELAGVPVQDALLDLVMSKATEPKVREAWRSIRKRLSAAIFIGAMVSMVLLGTNDAHAATVLGTTVYYHKLSL